MTTWVDNQTLLNAGNLNQAATSHGGQAGVSHITGYFAPQPSGTGAIPTAAWMADGVSVIARSSAGLYVVTFDGTVSVILSGTVQVNTGWPALKDRHAGLEVLSETQVSIRIWDETGTLTDDCAAVAFNAWGIV